MRKVSINPNPVATTNRNFSADLDVDKWRHRITAQMGFDTASCRVQDNQTRLEELFSLMLGSDIVRYAPDGERVVWGGQVTDLTLSLPGITYSISLDTLGNRMRTRYTPVDNSTSPPSATAATTTTATASDTNSQSDYGIKDIVLSAGQTTATIAAQIRDAALALYKRPRRSASLSSGQSDVALMIGCKGYSHTPGWQVYNQTAVTGTQDANLQIADLLTAGAPFISRSVLSANTTAIPKYTNSDRTVLDQIQSIASLGDASGNRWVAPVLESRVLYYKQVSNIVEYSRKLQDNKQLIFSNIEGGPVPYELIRPDRWLRTLDVMTAQTGGVILPSKLQDFQLMFIESVEWSEPDLLTMNGSVGDSVQVMIARQAALGERLL